MKSLSKFVSEAKSTGAQYDKQEVESAYSGHRFKLMIGNDGELEHVYIKPYDAKKFFDKLGERFYVSYYELEDIKKELADKLWIVALTYDRKDTNSRIKDLEEEVLCPIVDELGMFWNSKQECNKFLRENRVRIKRDYKRAKVSAITVSEFVELTKSWSKKFSFNISNLKIFNEY